MTEEEQLAEDVRWMDGEATAEEAFAERFGKLYPLSRSAKVAAASNLASAARYRRILSALKERERFRVALERISNDARYANLTARNALVGVTNDRSEEHEST